MCQSLIHSPINLTIHTNGEPAIEPLFHPPGPAFHSFNHLSIHSSCLISPHSSFIPRLHPLISSFSYPAKTQQSNQFIHLHTIHSPIQPPTHSPTTNTLTHPFIQPSHLTSPVLQLT